MVDCGGEFTMILAKDGTLWLCGNNTNGQLGLGDIEDTKILTKIKINNVKHVSCGFSHTMIIKTDDTLWGCGHNSSGQLGLGNNNGTNTFIIVEDMKNVKQVACGNFFTMVVKNDGTLGLWKE